jgi:hypothetical protein
MWWIKNQVVTDAATSSRKTGTEQGMQTVMPAFLILFLIILKGVEIQTGEEPAVRCTPLDS